jgi:hypothetical protein
MSSASIFRRLTNQPAIPDRRACAKQKDILLMQDTTIWRTTTAKKAMRTEFIVGCYDRMNRCKACVLKADGVFGRDTMISGSGQRPVRVF